MEKELRCILLLAMSPSLPQPVPQAIPPRLASSSRHWPPRVPHLLQKRQSPVALPKAQAETVQTLAVVPTPYGCDRNRTFYQEVQPVAPLTKPRYFDPSAAEIVPPPGSQACVLLPTASKPPNPANIRQSRSLPNLPVRTSASGS